MTQYIKKIVIGLAALTAAAFMFSSNSLAADFTDLCSDAGGAGVAGLPCTVDSPQFNSGPSGNDKEESVEAALSYVYGEIIDVTEMTKIPEDGEFNTGTFGDFVITGVASEGEYSSINWEYTGAADTGPEYATVKSSTGYAIFFVGGLTSGSLFTDNLITNNGNGKAISHLTFWNGDVPQVPTPEIASLMLIGLASVVIGTRRRKKT
ncbi:hypothetical protein [Emcibacter sp.]|uniref:hypothetical protein n=1 Tax=Emcibacter sp. TaxID=1979954 RepID=UPI002AA70001|nr:hypothetical protein [Emcibacter sp.]